MKIEEKKILKHIHQRCLERGACNSCGVWKECIAMVPGIVPADYSESEFLMKYQGKAKNIPEYIDGEEDWE